jgi:hypothetical protein
MDFYEALAAKAVPVNIEPSSTSYFSKPQVGLDPRLFVNGKLISSVRNSVLTVLYNYLSTLYQTPQDWTSAWLAGSGVSHQWAAKRYPGDLDCLVGIDYLAFRQANLKYTGLNNQEIANMLNEGFKADLWPLTENFLETFELTFYVNVQSDIKKIKPYAAYSLVNNDWVVEPTIEEAPTNPQWTVNAEKDKGAASEIIARYATALNAVNSSTNPAMRINAERALKLAVDQASALFEDIHQGRKYAFSESGSGYLDYNNYRWQAGKEAGIVQALAKLKEIADMSARDFGAATYGIELPNVSTLIRRAATHNR